MKLIILLLVYTKITYQIYNGKNISIQVATNDVGSRERIQL